MNESGIYELTFGSRKPGAIAVIPSIRKTGKYTSPDVVQNNNNNTTEQSITIANFMKEQARRDARLAEENKMETDRICSTFRNTLADKDNVIQRQKALTVSVPVNPNKFHELRIYSSKERGFNYKYTYIRLKKELCCVLFISHRW